MLIAVLDWLLSATKSVGNHNLLGLADRETMAALL